jgi:hypothetical protein
LECIGSEFKIEHCHILTATRTLQEAGLTPAFGGGSAGNFSNAFFSFHKRVTFGLVIQYEVRELMISKPPFDFLPSPSTVRISFSLIFT